MADASAGVDVVVSEGGANELLDEECLLVGATRGGDAADRIVAVLALDAPHLRGGVTDRFVPAHLTPRIGDLRADHRCQDTVPVSRVAPGEAPLDARVA